MPLIHTKMCPECGREDQYEVTEDELTAYMNGAFVQVAFPHLTVDQREQLITGLDKECWDKVMGPEPE
jgi:hypothetical protein